MDKTVALLLVDKEDIDNMHVYIGQIIKFESSFRFVNKSQNWNLNLEENQIKHLTHVQDELKDIFLNADYYISLTVENISPEEIKAHNGTGLIF